MWRCRVEVGVEFVVFFLPALGDPVWCVCPVDVENQRVSSSLQTALSSSHDVQVRLGRRNLSAERAFHSMIKQVVSSPLATIGRPASYLPLEYAPAPNRSGGLHVCLAAVVKYSPACFRCRRCAQEMYRPSSFRAKQPGFPDIGSSFWLS